jgi:hypothetical protein
LRNRLVIAVQLPGNRRPCRCKSKIITSSQSDHRRAPPANREGSSGSRRSLHRQSSQNAAREVPCHTWGKFKRRFSAAPLRQATSVREDFSSAASPAS